MFRKLLITIIAMTLSAMATAEVAPNSDSGNIKWTASTGMGYDSNAFQAPRSPYSDVAAGDLLRKVNPAATDPYMVPKAKSGFFVPYAIKADMAKARGQDSRLLVAGAVDGSFYLGSGLSNANKFNASLKGGTEYILASKEKSEDTLYVGALFENHKKVYADHDSGTDKFTVNSSKDISTLYNYIRVGVEANYKHRTGDIDYGANGKYAVNDYENPPGAPQQDHSYFTIGVDTSIPVVPKTRLNLSYDHAVRDYTNRHSHDLTAAFSTSLLAYTFDTFGASLRNRISPDWLLYLDLDHSTRADNYQGYGDYKENRYGARLLYEQGSIKTRLAFHHWGRDYPHAFAFDVLGQPAKTYSGNDLKFKAEMKQTDNTALWAELVYEAQNTTDLRYDYVRTQLMAGMSWAY